MGERKQPQLVMVRKELSNLPQLALPSQYTIRSFQPGDETAWEQIIQASFEDPNASFKMMTEDTSFLPERIFFACYNGTPVATASAWWREQWGEDSGYLHMVGLVPSHAGKGIGLQVSLAALHQMWRENKANAVLQTDDFRIPAIRTYLKLGFEPQYVHENHPERWKNIFSQMNHVR